MAVKKITRKVISREEPAKTTDVSTVAEPPRAGGADGTGGAYGTKKVCFFCQSKTNPAYTDTSVLRRFTSDRAKIVPRLRSGLCAKHQRALTRNIKYARHLSLLPFIPQV